MKYFFFTAEFGYIPQQFKQFLKNDFFLRKEQL